ncbi:MAG: hypothetical protein PUD07_04230 [bacterium]|nr:hypothetical protein [bacterium]
MKNRNIILSVIVLLLILCTGISVSYAFFKISKSTQDPNITVNIDNVPACVSLQMTNTNIVSITNEYAVPITDAKALSSDVYKTSFDVINNCDSSKDLTILLAPTNSSTMPVSALKYALVEQSEVPSSGTLISDKLGLNNGTKLELKQKYNQDISIGYSVGNKTVPAKTTKSYNLYLWIDENEGGLGQNITMNKLFEGYIVLGSGSLGTPPTPLYDTIQAKYNEGNTFVKLYDGEGSDTYTNSVYYYNGAVEDNNVLFANFCWKMVRTTDTGGVKLIYNGTPKTIYESVNPLEESQYLNLSNDANYPYTFDSTNKTWTSTNKTNSATGTITFTVAEAGDYILSYTVSSEKNYDKAIFYKDGTKLGTYSGSVSGTINLDGLTTSNVIKVEYTKDSSAASGSDNVVFSLGKPSGNSYLTCNNTGTDSQIGTSKFNSSYTSPAYVGYMYNTVYTYSSKSMSSLSNIVFGNSFTYSGGTYTLTDTMTVATWSSGYNTINNNHYTCFTTGTTCPSLYYVYYTNSSTAYYITLTGGKSVGDALNEMLFADDVNKTDSAIKTYIETWYENNMTAYTSYLEDTTYCNDRSILNLNSWNPNGGDVRSYLQFKNYNTNYSLVCGSVTDQFRVGNTKAPLKYPVGLLTAPEVWLAYKDASYSTYYLNTGNLYWLGSPYDFDYYSAVGRSVDSSGLMSNYYVNDSGGARLAVSLKPGTEYISGDGTYTSPFLIE